MPRRYGGASPLRRAGAAAGAVRTPGRGCWRLNGASWRTSARPCSTAPRYTAARPLKGWETGDGGVQVRTNRGVYQAERLVLTAGAWTHRLLARYHGVLQPERQVLIWMQPRVPSAFRWTWFPVFILDVEEGHFYGMPTYGIPGFKLGRFHHLEQLVDDPATIDRGFYLKDEACCAAWRGAISRTATARFCPPPPACSPTPGRPFRHRRSPRRPARDIRRRLHWARLQILSVIGEILADLGRRRRHPGTTFPCSAPPVWPFYP